MRTLALSVLFLAAATTVAGQAKPTEARIRVVHAVPDAPAVDVYANGAILVQGLPFKAATDHISVPPGTYEVTVNVAGTGTTVIRDHFTLWAGTDYSSVAIGRVGTGLRLLTVGDDLLPRSSGQIGLRVIHAAPSAPAVDVYVGSPFAPLNNASPVLTGVPFGAASFHLNVPNGVYQGRVTPAGTKTVAIDSPLLRLEDRAVRTLIAVDAVGGGAPFEIISLVDRD